MPDKWGVTRPGRVGDEGDTAAANLARVRDIMNAFSDVLSRREIAMA